SGAMGGSAYKGACEEFQAPCPVGEDIYVACPACGYAANTEAVTTPAPAPSDPGAAGPLTVLDTPGTPTIETLVAHANAVRAGGRADWTAADTLKNVVVRVSPPGVDSYPLVIGVPGDREVDLKRVGAALYPAGVALFEA